MNAPSLRRRPLLVSGMPIALDILDLKAETPMNLQIENPPRFTAAPFYSLIIRFVERRARARARLSPLEPPVHRNNDVSHHHCNWDEQANVHRPTTSQSNER